MSRLEIQQPPSGGYRIQSAVSGLKRKNTESKSFSIKICEER